MVGRTALGIVFAMSAIQKLRYPARFLDDVAAYRVLPRVPARAFGIVVIAGETMVAIALLSSTLVGLASLGALALLAAFAAAVTVNLHRGQYVACGCFGDPNEAISGRTLFRLILLIAVTAALWAGTPLASTFMPFQVVAANASVAGGTLLNAILLIALGNWILTAWDLGVLTREIPARATTRPWSG